MQFLELALSAGLVVFAVVVGGIVHTFLGDRKRDMRWLERVKR